MVFKLVEDHSVNHLFTMVYLKHRRRDHRALHKFIFVLNFIQHLVISNEVHSRSDHSFMENNMVTNTRTA